MGFGTPQRNYAPPAHSGNDRWTPQQWKIYHAFGDPSYFCDQTDVQPGALYDSISYTRGATMTRANSQFFTNVGSHTNKTFVDTNMDQPNVLCAPEAFSISRIMFTFSRQCDPRDVMDLAERLCFQLWLGKKLYQRHVLNSLQQRTEEGAPFRICEYCRAVYVQMEQCPGCGARDFALATGMGTDDRVTGHCFFLDLSFPLVIDNMRSFMVDFALPNNAGITLRHALKLWCHLIGLHARGVS